MRLSAAHATAICRWQAASNLTMVILRKPVAGVSDSALARFVARAGRAISLRGAVNVMVAGSADLRMLNHRFRGKDAATDVLSFPAGRGFGGRVAGDIAISADIARQNARLLGHSPAQEIKILTLHGLLHLAGYDHDRDHGRMAAREAKLRRALGLPSGLIERNHRRAEPRMPSKPTIGGNRARRTARRS